MQLSLVAVEQEAHKPQAVVVEAEQVVILLVGLM
jgi:hypothetical protein